MRTLFILSPLAALLLPAVSAPAQSVHLLHDSSSPQAAYAARRLGEALTERGYAVRNERTGYDYLVNLGVNTRRLLPEAYEILPEGRRITVYGGDERGMIYGALALAEQVRDGAGLDAIEQQGERAELEFRAIKFNLPWETYRPSSALDQHYETVRDLRYWEAFLDMMVENRFNVLSLWNMHPYTFMILPKNFPEASPWTPEELAEWRSLYRGILRMAKERGMDTYLIHWSIFVSPAFAEAHRLEGENFYPHYYVDGDGSELVRRYLRESVTQVLEEYPDLDGIGISHGEGMGGMTPLERQEWMDDVILEGMLLANRPSKLIHRVPFSSGTSSAPGASTEVETITRTAMEALGDSFEGPIWVEMKFNWSHPYSSTELIKVHGGVLGDTYFVPEPTNYKVTWMARNEDFLALRWGAPDFIREHVSRNGTPSYVGGYFIGSETYIPALDYFTAIEEPVDWEYAFQRQWLYYQLWGRLLYNPATPDEVFRAGFTRRYGPAAAPLLDAYALVSTVPLRLGSLYNSTWDFTLYAEGLLALQGQYTNYIGVNRLITQPTMDPNYLSVNQYVQGRIAGESFGEERVTPVEVADLLERDAREALRIVEGIAPATPSLMYEVADVRVWAHLGLHLAEKIRGAIALQSYRLRGGGGDREEAVRRLEAALTEWDEIIAITRPIYRDMRLTHYNHNFFTPNEDNLFHWALVRDEVANDVEVAKSATVDPR